MTDPIGTAQVEEVVMLSSVCGHHFADDCQACASAKISNDARLQSRIAEVGRLTEALDDCVASLAAIRATAANPDEWALSAEHFSTVCLESLKVARDALSLQRRV